MPKGELYLKTKATRSAVTKGDARGILIGNGSPATPSIDYVKGWTDAYVRYGLSLEDGAISKILAPSPMKQPTNSRSANQNGVSYLGSTIGKCDERMLSFDVHICAPNEEIFLKRYNLFRSEVLACGYLQLSTKWTDDVYHLIYQDCQQFSQFRMEMAKFTLSFVEPHPEIRDNRIPSIML